MKHPYLKPTGLLNMPVAPFLISASTFLLSLLPFSKIVAQGNLMIMPKRIVFENGKRSGEINLANTGKDTARYEISLIHYKMKDDGTLELLKPTDSSFLYADKYVRFFPRSVVLGPNESQIVRLQTTKTANLAEGEYRSHLYFRAVSEPTPLSEEKVQMDSTKISFQLKPVFGLSIPVIIRSGESNTQITLSDLKLKAGNRSAPVLTFNINRTGNMSVYGNISVRYDARKSLNEDSLRDSNFNKSEEAHEIALVKGIAVYTPNTVRPFRIALNSAQPVDYTSGTLYVVFTDQSGRKTTVAQQQINLHKAL